MFRFTIRDVLWLTVVAALGVGWWLDRSQLAVPAADYRRLKAEETERNKLRGEFFELLRSSSDLPFQGDVTEDRESKSKGLRPIPGDADYQIPPDYRLDYFRPPDPDEDGRSSKKILSRGMQ